MVMEVGDEAPGIDLPDDAGGHWRLSEHRGAPALVIFHRHLA